MLTLLSLLSEHLIIGSIVTNGGNGKKVVCYFEDWASGRNGNGKFYESNLLDAPCTHVIYSFATLDGNSNQLQYPFTPSLISELHRKGVLVLLAVGGATDSKGDKYSRMVSTPESRKVFIDSVLKTLEQHDFDGFDVDWEYPTCHHEVDSCGSPPQDKSNFVSLMRELRQALKGKILTLATHAGANVVNLAYDLPALKDEVDWFNVMTYDLHGSWDGVALHNSPLFMDDQGLSTDSATQLYKSLGVPPEKIVIGEALFGHTLRLAVPSQHWYGAPTSGVGDAGPYTQEAGILSYLEICEKVRSSGWRVEEGTEKVGPLAYGSGQVVGFDDVKMAERKARYAKEQGLGGVMLWAVSYDDFRGSCGCGKYPLVSALYNTLVAGTPSQPCQL